MKITYHVFSDGHGFVDLGEDATPIEIRSFMEDWERTAKEMAMSSLPKTFFIANVKVTVVEHAVPFLATSMGIVGGGH